MVVCRTSPLLTECWLAVRQKVTSNGAYLVYSHSSGMHLSANISDKTAHSFTCQSIGWRGEVGRESDCVARMLVKQGYGRQGREAGRSKDRSRIQIHVYLSTFYWFYGFTFPETAAYCRSVLNEDYHSTLYTVL